MGFSIVSLVEATLLLLNALAILSERRFLARFNLAATPLATDGAVSTPMMFDQTFGGGFNGGGGGGNGGPGNSIIKQQIAQLLASVRMLLRWPLIFMNAATIVFALILG